MAESMVSVGKEYLDRDTSEVWVNGQTGDILLDIRGRTTWLTPSEAEAVAELLKTAATKTEAIQSVYEQAVATETALAEAHAARMREIINA